MILPSPELWHRDDFPILCNWRKLWRAAEVGVDRGEYAATFLSRWQGWQWWGIDDYLPYDEMPHDRDPDYLMAVARIAPHAGRARILRTDSAMAAASFKPGSLDFVYIDGAHDYTSVRADLAAWYPALSEAGILAGHDWSDYPIHRGVREAVTEFAGNIGRDIYLTTVQGYNREDCPSWYLYRSGMPGPDWRRC